MTTKQVNSIRWAALVPCALLATIIVRIGAEAVFRYVLGVTLGFEPWTQWVAKGMAALLMGAVFVLSAQLVAPSAKAPVAATALGFVVAWGAVQLVTSLDTGSLVVPLSVGVGGALGGAVAFVLLGRSGQTSLR